MVYAIFKASKRANTLHVDTCDRKKRIHIAEPEK